MVINHPAEASITVTVSDRTVLVDKAIATVKKNLLEGRSWSSPSLFLFLGNLRAAIITALVIPLSISCCPFQIHSIPFHSIPFIPFAERKPAGRCCSASSSSLIV